ncbi:MAG: hypothetical protein ACKOVB_03275 [Terrabacter sp.]
MGFTGRSDGGFWGVFLWSVVGFVVGSLVAIAITGRGTASQPDETGASGGPR